MVKLKSSQVFWYAVIAAIGFVLVMTLIMPFIQTAVVPWWNKILGIEEPTIPGEVPSGFIYSGSLTVTLNTYDVYNDVSYNPDDAVDIRILHADQETIFGSATTLDGTDSISGQVTEADQGILYLVIDHDTGTTEYYLDEETADANGYLTALTPTDDDEDGTFEHYFKLDVTSLAPLAAGETTKAITLNLYAMDADVAYTITSIAQGTSADFSGSTYLDSYATAYWASGALGDGCVFTRFTMVMPDAANTSMVTDGDVKNIWVSVQGDYNTLYKWTNPELQEGQDRFMVWEADDVTQETQGKTLLYDRNIGSAEVGKITIHAKCANFGAGEMFQVTVTFKIIDPAGGSTSETLAMTFTDS